MSESLYDSPEFIEFWELYPRKTGKLAAAKAFSNALAKIKGLTPATIISGVRSFAARCAIERTPEKFIPIPATYLNQGRWMDREMEKYPAHTPSNNLAHHSVNHSDYEQRWTNWLSIRSTETAVQAAREGWAWSLRCKVLDGSVASVGQIDTVAFLQDRDRCEENESRVNQGLAIKLLDGSERVILGEFVQKYLDGRRQLLFKEAEAASEIERAAKA